MRHKRKKCKNARTGCLLCKLNKVNGWNKDALGHRGFGKLKSTLIAKHKMKEHSQESL